MRQIDLHIHTTFSDGNHTPKGVLDKAYKKNIRLISITDHDTIDGLLIAQQIAAEEADPITLPPDVAVIAGIELSCEQEQKEVHVLGYLFDTGDAALRNFLLECKNERVRRVEKITAILREKGFSLTPEDVYAEASSGIIGRPHIAHAMVKKGIVSTIGQAFYQYLAANGSAYVPKYKVSVQEACDIIHRAGGLAVIAHPGGFSEEFLEKLMSFEIDGLEAVHPSHTHPQSLHLQRLAEQRFLLATGGSDFHGEKREDYANFGSHTINYSVYEQMLKRKERRVQKEAESIGRKDTL